MKKQIKSKNSRSTKSQMAKKTNPAKNGTKKTTKLIGGEALTKKLLGLIKSNESDANVLPTDDYNPLNEEMRKIPKVEFRFYLEELLDWILNDFTFPFKQNPPECDFKMISDIIFPESLKEYKTEFWKDSLIVDEFLKGNSYSTGSDKDYSYEHLQTLQLLLENVKQHPAEFIDIYIQRQSLTKNLHDNNSAELICIDKIIERLGKFLVPNNQLIPELTYSEYNYYLFSHDANKIDVDYDAALFKKKFNFIKLGFSNKTSMAFTNSLIEVLSERKKLLESLKIKENISTQENVTPDVNVKKRMKTIIKELGLDNKKPNSNLGKPSTLLLFNELKKENIINANVSKSEMALAIAILTRYSFDDLLNANANIEKDISELYDGVGSNIINSKLSTLLKSVEKISSSIKATKDGLE